MSKNPGGTKRVTSLADALKLSFGIVTTDTRRPKHYQHSMAGSVMFNSTEVDRHNSTHSLPNGYRDRNSSDARSVASFNGAAHDADVFAPRIHSNRLSAGSLAPGDARTLPIRGPPPNAAPGASSAGEELSLNRVHTAIATTSSHPSLTLSSADAEEFNDEVSVENNSIWNSLTFVARERCRHWSFDPWPYCRGRFPLAHGLVHVVGRCTSSRTDAAG